MPEQWNKYERTAARKHGKPGREIRPTSTTIDIHSHVAVPQAAAFVKPHLDATTIPLAHFADDFGKLDPDWLKEFWSDEAVERVLTDAGQIIELFHEKAGFDKCSIHLNGFGSFAQQGE